MPRVTMAGARLTGASWVDPTPVSATDATEYARVLRVAVPGGTRLGSTLPVTVAGAVNYAGRSLDPAWKGDVKVAPRPAKIALDYAEAVPVQVGTTRSLRVRILDKQDGPIAGATVTATGSNTTFAKVSGAPGKTDGLGATTIQVEALLPGTSWLTLAVAGTGLARTVELATTLDPVEDSVAYVARSRISTQRFVHRRAAWCDGPDLGDDRMTLVRLAVSGCACSCDSRVGAERQKRASPPIGIRWDGPAVVAELVARTSSGACCRPPAGACIFMSRSLRNEPLCLVFEAGFRIGAVMTPSFTQVGEPFLRPRVFGARNFKHKRVFRSESPSKKQPLHGIR